MKTLTYVSIYFYQRVIVYRNKSINALSVCQP